MAARPRDIRADAPRSRWSSPLRKVQTALKRSLREFRIDIWPAKRGALCPSKGGENEAAGGFTFVRQTRRGRRSSCTRPSPLECTNKFYEEAARAGGLFAANAARYWTAPTISGLSLFLLRLGAGLVGARLRRTLALLALLVLLGSRSGIAGRRGGLLLLIRHGQLLVQSPKKDFLVHEAHGVTRGECKGARVD